MYLEIKDVKKKDPELAQKLKNFYNLSGDDK